MAGQKSRLEFTGERFTPECVREIFYEHWHRYAWAAPLVEGFNVLDCACGEGYGSALLAGFADQVTGVDIDPASIEHARTRYPASNLEFQVASALALPFDDDSFDVVVSFETLEHLAEHNELLSEFRRVLRPNGFILLSSPDKKTYSDDTGFENEFHVRELYRDEFEALLSQHFPAYRLLGQKLMFHSAMWTLDDRSKGHDLLTLDENLRLQRGPQPVHPPLYFIAVAAADACALPQIKTLSLFDDHDESIYAHYNNEVRAHIRAGELLAERDAEIKQLQDQLATVRPEQHATIWQRLKTRLARK